VSEEGVTKYSTKETHHQTPSDQVLFFLKQMKRIRPSLGASRNLILCFSQSLALGPSLIAHT